MPNSKFRCRIFACTELEVYRSISEGSRHGGNFYKYAFHDVIVGKPVALIRLSSCSQLLSHFQVIKLCGGIASIIAVLPFTISFSREVQITEAVILWHSWRKPVAWSSLPAPFVLTYPLHLGQAMRICGKKSVLNRDISLHNIFLDYEGAGQGHRGLVIDFEMAVWSNRPSGLARADLRIVRVSVSHSLHTLTCCIREPERFNLS